MVRKLSTALIKCSGINQQNSDVHASSKSPAMKSSSSNNQVLVEEDESRVVPPIGTHHQGNFHVYMTHKILKLREIQKPHVNEIESSIFNNCIMFINGYTNPPIEELRRLIHQHGGETIAYRAIKITHFVCNNFTDAQLKAEYSKTRLNLQERVHNVTSAWILDSIERKKRLDENQYSPRGLSFRYGRDISTMLVSSSSSMGQLVEECHAHRYSDDVEQNNSIDVSSDKSISSDRSDSPVLYTSSQEAFVNAVPMELRAEVSAQIKVMGKRQKRTCGSAVPAAKRVCNSIESSMRNGIAFRDEDDHESLPWNDDILHKSSSSMVNQPSRASSRMVNNSPGVSSIITDEASFLHRKGSLESMIACIHFTHGCYNSSRSIQANMRLYIDALLTIDSSYDHSRNNYNNNNNNNKNNNNNNNNERYDLSPLHQVQCSTSPSKAAVVLLEDYGLWLICSDQFDQVVVLLREVRRSSARMTMSQRGMMTSMSPVSGDGVKMSGSASEGSCWRALADHLTVLFKERISNTVGATLKSDLTSFL